MATSSIQDDLPRLEPNSDEDDESMRNGSVHSSDDDDQSDGCDDDWNEMEQDNEPTRCLFCDSVEDSIEVAIKHLSVQHNCNLATLRNKFNMDQYSYIKMINYIRTHNIGAEMINTTETQLWLDEKYLKPVEIEPWLMFDVDEARSILSHDTNVKIEPKAPSHIVEDLERQLKEKDAVIEHLSQQIVQMKISFQSLIDRTDTGAKSNATALLRSTPCVGQVPIHQDNNQYFSTYSHYDVHHDMLSDKVRTDSFRDAIFQNSELFTDKIVLDVGCGTSILSMFASKAGAKQVIAIDQSEIIYYAMDIVRKNNIENIQLVKGRLEDTEMPIAGKVDIIISEWMGYFLLFEGMLDSVIYAREHHLKENGYLMPNRCNISLVGFGDEQRHRDFIKFWENVYDFDMTPLQPEVLKEVIVEVCQNEHVLTDPVVIAEFNLMTVEYSCRDFTFSFEMTIKRDGKFTGFLGYFDTFFDLPQPVSFSTGPHTTPTHWKQVIFYIKNPIKVMAGEVINGKFTCRRGLKDFRALCIEINVFDQTFHYSLN